MHIGRTHKDIRHRHRYYTQTLGTDLRHGHKDYTQTQLHYTQKQTWTLDTAWTQTVDTNTDIRYRYRY